MATHEICIPGSSKTHHKISTPIFSKCELTFYFHQLFDTMEDTRGSDDPFKIFNSQHWRLLIEKATVLRTNGNYELSPFARIPFEGKGTVTFLRRAILHSIST
jgi:hypothetical protein